MKKNLKNNGIAPGKRKRIAPADVPKLVKAGRALLSKGQTDELIRVCSDALRQLPGHPDFIRLQFLALIKEKKYSETIRFLQKWAKHPASKTIPTQYIIGYGYYLIKRYKSAHQHLAEVLAMKPDMPVARLLMSRALSDAGHPIPALEALKKGPALVCRKPQNTMTYATVLNRLEQYQSAKNVLNNLLKSGSMVVECAYELIRLPAETWSPETCDLVGELLHRPKLTVRQKTLLNFSAGRIADHQGRYHDAFSSFAEAKKLSTNEFDFDVFGKAVTACTSESGAPAGRSPARPKQAPAVTPLFILGLPRSGKTTLENLLARRTEFAACGEVSPRMFVDEDIFVGAQEQLPSNYADRLTNMKSTRQDMYTRQYTEQICEQFFLPETTRYIINTMPHNFLNIRTINKIFPSSKFVYVKRNNYDLFTFCYMKNFKSQYNYTRDFDTFIQYYNMFYEVISHWQNALSSNFTTVSYEDLVKSPDDILNQLYEFLDVDISADNAPVAKAATAGLTDRYIDYWKNYQDLFSHADRPAT